MLLVKRRPATFYGVAPAKPSGTRVRGRIRVPEPFRVPALDEMNGYQNSKTLCDLIYSPLDKSKREIRLFNMLPSPEPESDIYCELFTVSLDSGPYYNTLS